MEGDKVLDLLEAQNWPYIIRHLTYYTIWVAKGYSRNFGSIDQLPEGNTPEDIAFSAIEKVWSGTRAWDPDKYPDLLNHLMWIVKSDMGHLFSSSEVRVTRRILQDEDDPSAGNIEKNTIFETSVTREASTKINTAEEELIARENKELEAKLIGELYQIVKGDDDLEILLAFFEDGIDKPERIAAEMGWDIAKVYNLKRKLFRKASKASKILSNVKAPRLKENI